MHCLLYFGIFRFLFCVSVVMGRSCFSFRLSQTWALVSVVDVLAYKGLRSSSENWIIISPSQDYKKKPPELFQGVGWKKYREAHVPRSSLGFASCGVKVEQMHPVGKGERNALHLDRLVWNESEMLKFLPCLWFSRDCLRVLKWR